MVFGVYCTFNDEFVPAADILGLASSTTAIGVFTIGPLGPCPPPLNCKKIVATRCQILRLKCTRFDFGWGSAPDPTGKAYSTRPDSLAGFKGDCVSLLFIHPDITLE